MATLICSYAPCGGELLHTTDELNWTYALLRD